jgi:transposase
MLLMRPYSEDLRRKIVAAVEGGMPKTEAARTFGVGLSSVKRYCRLAAHEEPLAPRKKGGGRPPKGRGQRLRARLPAALLAGHEPHLGGLRQGQGAHAAGRGTHP